MRRLGLGFTCLLALGCSEEVGNWPFTLQSALYPGAFAIRGTITLPADLETSALAALTLTSATTASPYTTLAYVDEAVIHDLGKISGSLDYGISGIASGRYLVGCLLDHDGDRETSAGDIGGYYAGTADAPALHASTAQVIEVTDQSLGAVDFGIGPVTCLAGYGETCSEDADCGGTLCSYGPNLRVRGLHAGTCDTAAGTCREAPGECPMLDGKAGVKSESGCFGAGPE